MNKAQKELYIHIGTHKTGTTALQQFFTLNRPVLKNNGIDYPAVVDAGDGHHRLAWSLLKEEGRPCQWDIKNLKSSKQEWSQALKNAGSRVLLSSETFIFSKPDTIRKIIALAPNYQVKMVVYFRRQDDMGSSVVNEVTKSSRKRWTEFKNPLPYKLKYIDYLDYWSQVIGRQNVIVRPYEKQQFYGGTIFSDFLHHVFNLEANGFEIPQGNINARLHRVILEYKRLINCLPISAEGNAVTLKPLLEISNTL